MINKIFPEEDMMENGLSKSCSNNKSCRSFPLSGRNNDTTRSFKDTDTDNNDARRILIPVRYRPLQELDRSEIKLLHEQWFPVKYKDVFYDSIVVNKMTGSDKTIAPIPLFTCAAIINNGGECELTNENYFITKKIDTSMTMFQEGDIRQSEDRLVLTKPSSSNRVIPNTVKRDEAPRDNIVTKDVLVSSSEKTPLAQQQKIVGCIVGSFNSIERLDTSLSSLLIQNTLCHPRIFYIMTLGTAIEHRNLGIGAALVQRAVHHAEQDEKCGAVYLHVITYNQAAISFYEKLDFVLVKEIEDYYYIDGQHFNCYVYAKYLNGNKGFGAAISMSSLFYTLVSSCWRLLKFPAYTAYSAYASFRVKRS